MNILNNFRRDDSIERDRGSLKSELAETVKERNSLDARFKTAVRDMAAQANEIAGLRDDVAAAEKVADARARKIAELNAEIAALKTDAEKLRSKRANDAALKREKRAAAKVTKAKPLVAAAPPAKRAA